MQEEKTGSTLQKNFFARSGRHPAKRSDATKKLRDGDPGLLPFFSRSVDRIHFIDIMETGNPLRRWLLAFPTGLTAESGYVCEFEKELGSFKDSVALTRGETHDKTKRQILGK